MWHGVHGLTFASTDTDTSSLLLSSSYLACLSISQASSKLGEVRDDVYVCNNNDIH